MISKDKVRVQVTVSKDLLPLIQDAADTWGMTVSQYITALCRADLETGLSAQMKTFVASMYEEEFNND